jgi:hypothetical protein
MSTPPTVGIDRPKVVCGCGRLCDYIGVEVDGVGGQCVTYRCTRTRSERTSHNGVVYSYFEGCGREYYLVARTLA